MIKPDVVHKHLLSRSYKRGHATSRKAQFLLSSNRSVYLNLASVSGLSSLIVHPEIDLTGLAGHIVGLKVGEKYFHSSNMLGFPTRKHRGEKPICFGKSLSFDSELALTKLLDHIEAA
jgi:hypothetical protein